MARIRTVDFLPEIFQTSVNRQFLSATLDQLTQEPKFEKTQGYVGRKVGPGVNPVDRYVIEPTKSRNDYQLEPGVVSLVPDSSTIADAITYPGMSDALNLQGAYTDNADRLYTSEYYSWDPFVDFDKMVNFSQYYWLPEGPDEVDVSATTVPLTDNVVVTRANGVYTFTGISGSNPVLTLVRDGNYTFEVAQNAKETVNYRVTNNSISAYVIDYLPNPTLTLTRGDTYVFDLTLDGVFPFYIKTIASLGNVNTYDNGVSRNGATTGSITFVVPQDAPDVLYYSSSTQINMRGQINIIDAQAGTGPGFWIQTDPGIDGKIPTTPNISSRNVLGVSNNGEDLGTISFYVPSSTDQDFYYGLTSLGTVDLLSTLLYDQVDGRPVAEVIAAGGIDGITDLNGRTVVFSNIAVPAIIYQIQYITVGLIQYIQLNNISTVANLEKFSILFGTVYASTEWYKNASGHFEQIPLLTAVRDTLWYQDGTDPEIFGQIRLIDESLSSTLNIADILGSAQYTSPNGVVFTNGLKVGFRGEVIPSSYQNNSYYVEGVGTAIKLLPVTDFVTPETYTQSESVPYDSIGYDIGGYDGTLNAPQVPEYVTINRASTDLNPWSRSNRWFHIDVINATAVYNNTTPAPDNLFRGRRPILEFRAGTKLFDFGTQGKQPVDVIDFTTTDALSNISGTTGTFPSNNLIVGYSYNITVLGTTNWNTVAGTTGITYTTGDSITVVSTAPGTGLATYNIDGYQLLEGSRVIFAADSNSDVRDKIYQVNFITPDPTAIAYSIDLEVGFQYQIAFLGTTNWNTVAGTVGITYAVGNNIRVVTAAAGSGTAIFVEPIINLVPADDADVLVDQTIVCLSGVTLQGLSFYYDGVNWISAQDKVLVNQAPLFDVYDSTGISFSNRVKYPSSTFEGTKLFSYAIGTGTADPVLNFPLRYLTLSNVGDIVFENNLYKDTFVYVTDNVGITTPVSLGFVRQYSDRTNFIREIGWQTAVTPSLSRQQFQFVYDGSPLRLDIKVLENNIVPSVQLYVGSAFQDPSNYVITTTATTTTITLTTTYVPGDIIEVDVLSDQVSTVGFYQVPINLGNNPLNGNSEIVTLGTVRGHYGTIAENLLDLQGPINGANNTRDLGNIIPYGLQILQQSAPMTLTGYFMRNPDYDIFGALDYNSREYIKIKSQLLETVIRNEYDNMTASEILDSAMLEVTKGRTDINPFYWSDMIPVGVVYSDRIKTITPITTSIFNTQEVYDFTSANYLGLLVYVNDILLLKDDGYVVSTDSAQLTITLPLAVGDVVTIREYTTTTGNFVPNTPTKLGLYPKYLPAMYYDTTYVNPTEVIRGHDGSITVAFADIRDEVLLEFEKRIYNNLKTDGNPVPLTIDQVSPGFFRTTDYSQTEITNILSESFLSWVGWNKINYKSQNYSATNPFTYNYSSAGNKINEAPLLGAWRGINRYFYDTETPDTTPWEMLNFSEKPTWWEAAYGPAPYTSDNLVLWDDLAAGYVADPVAPYFKPEFARPASYVAGEPRNGIWREKYGLGPYPSLLPVIPTSSEGQLLAPIDSVVGQYDPNAFRKSWVVGDGGPAESAWWTSSSYPFAVMRLLSLTRPAEFFSLFADRDLYRYDADLGQYLYNGRYRLDANGIEVYGDGVSKASYINWIVDYKQQLGRNSTAQLTADLQNLDVRLCYRMASFTDKQYLKVFTERASPDSTNSSLLLPDESYNLLLYKNQPFAEIIYSALIVERVDDGYAIYGYSTTNPYFEIFASASNGVLTTVSAGGTTVRVPVQYTDTVVQVPYGYVFTNTTVVVDFILSYGAYLKSQGLVFDDRENGYTLDWNQMAQEFLYFSQQGWASGTMVNLNPAATKLKATRTGAVVDTIVSVTPENMLLDQNRVVLPTRDLVVERLDNTFSITSITNQTISYLKLKFTSFENMVVLDNRSVFNDLIYNPITAARQSRIRITAATTTEWNGQLDAQGFILNQDNIKEWQPSRKYAKGEIVLYKATYWSAVTIVQPKVEFNYNDWVKSDYTVIQQGLLPNIANKADQLANSYDTQVANLERDNDLLSYGLIGFKPRQYMQDLNLDDVSQVNLYQQFIKSKGTIRSAEIFTRADLGKESAEYNIFENWGVLVSTYGANANRSFIEFRLNESLLPSDPSTVQVIEPQQSSGADQTILLENVWRSSFKLTSTDIFPTTYDTTSDTALPSAGYVNINDTDINVFSLDDPTSISANLDSVGIGTIIWVARSNSYDWDIYRCERVAGQVQQITDNLNDTSVVQFSTGHNLTIGDLVVIRYFNTAVDGVYRVLSVPSLTTIVIAFSFASTNQTVLTGEGLAFYLQSSRVAQASDVASLPYVNLLIPGARAWVDNNGSGHWEVLEKQNPFTEYNQLIPDAEVENGKYGASVTQTVNHTAALVGSPEDYFGAGAVYAYYQDSTNNNYAFNIELLLSTVDTAEFGASVDFGNQNWAVVGAPGSANDTGYVLVMYLIPSSADYINTQLLTAPDLDFSNSRFGTAVTISDDERWMYVGAPGTNKVYAYARIDAGLQTTSYLGDGVENTFNYSSAILIDSANLPTTADQLLVTVNGNNVFYPADYTITATDIVFATAPGDAELITISRRAAVEFTGNNVTTTFELSPYLYTATNLYAFTVLLNGVIQRPEIDYDFNDDSSGATQDLTFTIAPPLDSIITVTAVDYWLPVGIITVPDLPVDAQFGYSIDTATDGRYVAVGCPSDTVDAVRAGRVYVFDRGVVRYLVTDTTELTYDIPGPVIAEPLAVAVLLNGQFLTNTALTPTGQFTVNTIAKTITLSSSVELTSGDLLEIETNEFQPLQSISANTVFDEAKFGFSVDLCPTNCTLVVGAPEDGSVLVQAGSADRLINQSRTYGVTTSFNANPVLTGGDTIRINNIEIAIPAAPHNTIQGLVNAISPSAYLATTQYYTGDRATYNSLVYVAITSTINHSPTDTAYWALSFAIPNVIASTTTDLTFVGDDVTQNFDIGNLYSVADSYNTLVYLDEVLQTTPGEYSYNNSTEILSFVTAPPKNKIIKVISGRMTVSVKNVAAAITYNKLQVLPGMVTSGATSAFDAIGFTTYAYQQTITSPAPTAYANFGSAISVSDSNINLVIGAPNGNVYIPVTFDSGTTYFDDRSTTFFTPIYNSGVAYTYDWLPSANASVTDPGMYAFGQQLYDTLDSESQPNDKFGFAVNYRSGRVLIGAPNHNTTGLAPQGQVNVFNNPTDELVWKTIHEQQPVVDVDLLNSVFTYDRLTSNVEQYFDFFDPLQGKILGAARRNIDYIGAVDPADYNVGTIHNLGNSWAVEHVGEIWWDTDTVRFIDPNQDDVTYASRRWGQVFPGSRVDIYQWVSSTVAPVSYTGPGVPLSLVSYTVNSSLNQQNIFETRYYFWVRGISTIDVNAGKTLSTVGIARYIETPRSSGIPYIAALNASTVAVYNALGLISAADTILHVEYDRELTDACVHQEYQLIADGRSDSFLNDILYRKLQDSFCGVDTRGGVVPDPLLSPPERYGVQFRPRQSMFADRFAALQNYLERANTILAQYPIVETRRFNLLNSSESEPLAGNNRITPIYNITNANPAVVETTEPHGLSSGDDIIIGGVGGMEVFIDGVPSNSLNGYTYYVQVINDYEFSLYNNSALSLPVDTTTYSTYNTIYGAATIVTGVWNQRVANLEELSYQNIAENPVGYRYLVMSDSSQNGRWTIYEVALVTIRNSIGQITSQFNELNLLRVQNYDTRLYWYHTNWYQPGYSSTKNPVAEVANYAGLSTLNLYVAPIGSSVKVTANGQGKFEIYLRTELGWDRVVLQDGTIQFREELWNYALGNFGFGVEVFDAQYFDQEPVIETRKIIQAINKELFIDDLALARNQSLMLMFNFIYSEFTAPDWLIKTSLVDVDHKIRALLPYQTYLQDNQDFVLDYIQEVKPYHVQIREFNLTYDGQDDYLGMFTDFDSPAYYDIALEIPQYVSPILTPYTQSGSAVESTVSDAAANTEIWTLRPWNDWFNNYLLAISGVTIVDGGAGYTVPPEVIITGECEIPAVMTAIINSAGRVVGVNIVDEGSGYLTTAIITFVGGNGLGARAVATMNNDLVRSIKTTLRYDRYQYSSTIQEWQPNVFYDNGELVRYLDQIWESNTSDSAASENPIFDPAEWIIVNPADLSLEYIPADGGTGNYYTPVPGTNYITGVDRTMGLYAPTINQPGLSLPLLIDGVEYPGVQVFGRNFNQTIELDTVFESSYLDLYLGTRYTDINVDGGAYVDTYSSYAPEELIPGAEFDTLDLRVYTRPGADWANDGHGFNEEIIKHTFSSTNSTLSWAGILSYPVQILVANQTTGYDLQLGFDYTADWVNQTITIIDGASDNDIIVISVYGLGGGNQLFKEVYFGTDVSDVIDIPVVYSQIQELAIFINGQVTDFYTYAPLYAEPGVQVTYNPVGSSGTTLVVTETVDIVVGSLITGEGFTSGQLVTGKINETTLTISAAPNSLPDGILTFRANTGATQIVFDSTVALEPGDAATVVAIGPTTVGSTVVDYSWSAPQTQIFVGATGVLNYALTNSLIYTNPVNMVVTVNGVRARTAACAEYDSSDSTAFLLPTRLGIDQSLIADNQVLVYLDDVLQQLYVDYVVEPIDSADEYREVILTDLPPSGTKVLVAVTTNTQCYINEGQLVFNPVMGLVPNDGDVVAVTTWNDTRQQNILTKVYVGPVTEGIVVNEAYDTTVFDAGSVTDDPGSFDYTAGIITQVNALYLGRVITNPDRLWVTLNGVRLFPGIGFTIQNDEIILQSGILTTLDVVMITEFTDSIVPEAMAFRIFQDMRGVQAVYRITPQTTTTTVANPTRPAQPEVLSTDDIIYVANASALSEPAVDINIWGVVMINGERIMYRVRNTANNTISSLLRGTAGTAADDHAVGATVTDLGRGNLLPAEFQNYIVETTTLADGSTTLFVADNIDVDLLDSTTLEEAVEVYVGGTLLQPMSGYSITLDNPVNIVFDTAPADGSEVTILIRNGVTWYAQGSGTASDGVALQDTNTRAARFLRGL